MNTEYKFMQVNYPNNAKKSVVWAMFRSALDEDCTEIKMRNGALAKTFEASKKKEVASVFDGVRVGKKGTEEPNGKYIKFPDGSSARY
jgi:hypothetical protein